MLITRSRAKVIDNTGVKQVYVIVDSGSSAKVGSIVPCVLERIVTTTNIKFSKGDLA